MKNRKARAAITGKNILATGEQAIQEVDRLNKLNSSRGVHYFWQSTDPLLMEEPLNKLQPIGRRSVRTGSHIAQSLDYPLESAVPITLAP